MLTRTQQREPAPPVGQHRPAVSIPGATYRLQFNRQFTFADAAPIIGYLRDLGITHCYASPLFQAGPDSTHGYDVCGFDGLNPGLGSPDAFKSFAATLNQFSLGLLLDMVPNHMGNDLSNRWFVDVLEKGPASEFANYFDINWHPVTPGLENRILLPILEDHYAKVLESGKLKIVFESGNFFVAYYDKRIPVSLAGLVNLLQELLTECQSDARTRNIAQNLQTLLESVQPKLALPSAAAKKEAVKIRQQLALWYESSPEFARAVDCALSRINGAPGKPDSFNKLDELLQQQHYRLAYWRVGSEEINYRRFFDVTSLISLRMESPEVFAATHQFLFCLMEQHQLTALRIDHPDGLWNPRQYCERLQQQFLKSNSARRSSNPPFVSTSRLDLDSSSSKNQPGPLYLLVEKILSADETLPEDWPVHGTTGYEFLNQLNALFVEPKNASAFTSLYETFTGCTATFGDVVYQSKKLILESSLISEVQSLTWQLQQLCRQNRAGQDFTFAQLHSALVELIACFPVYRTYVTEETETVSPHDRKYIEAAFKAVRCRNPDFDGSIFDFLSSLLLLELPLPPDQRSSARLFIMKFQQLTGPAAAKGVEDTAFYRYLRLVALNEVGGDPEKFGLDITQFHRLNSDRFRRLPHNLLASATHDTKRGEDLRARLNVLSEMPDEWRAAIEQWSHVNAPNRQNQNGSPAPSANDEYLFYQSILGAWPPELSIVPGSANEDALSQFRQRIAEYMLKAVKEAKARTSWANPDSAYETAVSEFVQKALAGPGPFLNHFQQFQRRVAFFGVFNSLSQTLLKLTSPGVPDVYQGSELWDLSLVDPDNRRPVDYHLRRSLLSDLMKRFRNEHVQNSPPLRELLQNWQNGSIKLFLIWKALQFRNAFPDLFKSGAYVPLEVAGKHAHHVCAFARTLADEAVVVVVPRFIFTLTQGREELPVGESIWADTHVSLPDSLHGSEFINILTGELVKTDESSSDAIPLSAAFSNFPVALLHRRN